MMKKSLLMVLIILAAFLNSCKKDDGNEPDPEPEPEGPEAVVKTNPTKVWAHYMPWFETPETSDNGSWGMHWTMATRNPEIIDGEGKREIASHYYPLIGPYASSDPDVIEYHLLLMKYSGIDGLIIDWYGSTDLWDYPLNRRNAEAVIDKLDEVGLTFAITYEDQTIGNLLNNGIIQDAVEGATADFQYMSYNYFGRDSYTTINGNPLLTIFGPQYIQNGDDWTSILYNIPQTPVFLSLWYESGDLGDNATGEFSWVYESNTHIRNFYNVQAPKFSITLGSAYPGFKDYYTEGGWSDNISWSIDYNDGGTLETTLGMATTAEAKYLQLVTWNDFGEGTMIEPTQEFGYSFLEIIQSFTGVSYTKNALEYIYKLYQLRKNYEGDTEMQASLDTAFDHLVKLELAEAEDILDAFN